MSFLTRKLILALLLATASACHGQDCSYSNSQIILPGRAITDSQEHSSGQHSAQIGGFTNTCTYNDQGNGNYCSIICDSEVNGSALYELGQLTSIYYQHVIQYGGGWGPATSNGPQISCGSQFVAAVRSCLLGIGCNLSVSINGSVNNIGGSVSLSNSAIWQTPTWSTTNTCAAVKLIPQGPSPILIDIGKEGFELTSQPNGVIFDIYGNGVPIKLSWTSASHRNAFLALDLNGNGIIDSGKELFGNMTAQPPSNTPNGFLALAEFDKLENGGNGDGIIDKRDKIFASLLLWIDTNHDGVSQPTELHHLADMGVESIDLKYTESRRIDEFGNRFRYRGRVGMAASGGVDRVIYDVFFVGPK